MAGVLRLLVMTIALWLIISSLRRVVRRLALSRRGKAEEKQPPELALVQDLQCGRFVLERDAVRTSWHGQALHFCSQKCRDLYRQSHLVAQQKTRE